MAMAVVDTDGAFASRRRRRRTTHPTKQALIDTMLQLMGEAAADAITADLVLERSGISRGSLYHHFEDFADLYEHALVRRFAAFVDESIAVFDVAFTVAKSVDDVRAALEAHAAFVHSPARAVQRATRIAVLAEAVRSERLRTAFGREQSRLNGAIADLVRRGQAHGWIVGDLDPHAVAVFIQAYTVGKVIDDVSADPIDPVKWDLLVRRILSTVLLVGHETSSETASE